MNLFYRYLYRNCIICLIVWMSVACTSTSTPTPFQPTTVKLPTSTPFPTPLPQFATLTPTPAELTTNNSQAILPTAIPTESSYAGTISGQSDTVTLYNGPQGATKGEINNRASIVVLGKSDDGQWIEIHLTGNINGWVQAGVIDTAVSMSVLPITGYVPKESPTPSPDAIVKSDAAGLRLRTQPNTESNVLTNLDAKSILTVIGRSGDSEWLQVIAPNRQRGWAMAQFLDVNVDVLRLPVTFGTNPTPVSGDIPASEATNVITNITAQAQRIFDRGITVGNRANVFSKIGDSLTVATWAFYPIGWGQYQLSSYAYLQPAIEYFSAEPVGEGNSFSNVPLAADNQWTTADLLDPAQGNPEICGVNETPLDCEFRIVRPSIALILIGTNDVGLMDGETYRENLENVLDKTIARSVLPVLSTLPRRSGYDAQIAEFNDIIRTTAQQYQIPIWEFYDALETKPNSGLEADGVHLSYPPVEVGQWEATANFVGDNLNYGYNVRNLTAIQVLDAVGRQVILGESP